MLSDYDDKLTRPYLKWIKGRTKTRVEVLRQKLTLQMRAASREHGRLTRHLAYLFSE